MEISMKREMSIFRFPDVIAYWRLYVFYENAFRFKL